MTADTLRWLAVICSTIAVLVVVFSLGIKWEERSTEMRAKGLVFAYILSAIDYGTWFARKSHFPASPALYLLLPGVIAAIAVYVYFLARDVRRRA